MTPRGRAGLAAVLSLWLWSWSCWAQYAQGEDVPVPEYARILRSLDGRLEHADAQGVERISAQLAQLRISWRQERLVPDPALVRALREHHDARARRLIAQMLAGLDAADHAPPAQVVDHQALQSLARSQQQQALAAHGDLDGMPILNPELSDHTISRLEALRDWLGARWDELMNLLSRWFGHSQRPGQPPSSSHLTLIVLIVIGVIAIGFTILALWQGRAAQAAPNAPASKSPASDADPRSRASRDWQRYADELFAAGRYREGVRAWYHAVLVQCWANGLIRHRQGWTNWEYASHLPSGWGSRVAFVDLTARFDRSWYGNLGGRAEAEAFAQHASTLYAALVASPP
jgi:hypothetical protein